jgi:predicted Fe-Mo cluster-binding NifX family protein
MKVAVSANGDNLEAAIDERFGRCPYFIIVDTDDMRFEALSNPNADLSSSAGIQSAGLVASRGVEAVITGNCGPKAMQVFAETNIAVVLNQHGVVRQAVDAFQSGKITPSDPKPIADPSGAPGTPPAGVRPSGMTGRGMGGCGRGMGGGGRGMGGGGMGRRCSAPAVAVPTAAPTSATGSSKGPEVGRLQQQADQLRRQLEAIENRIKELA